MKARLLSSAIYLTSSAIGVLAFLYPFLWPGLVRDTSIGNARTAEMPLLLTAILGLSLLVLLFEVQGHAVDTKLVALLGVLVALNSVLRFIEIAIPGPGGFSPIFFLIIITGYVFGGRFGFLMGALTLLVSALVTGGVGPWLPGQMLAAGWTGMSAPLLRPLARLFRLQGRYAEVLLLAFFGALWGMLYGVIMNLWSWPFIAGPIGQSYVPGAGLVESLRLYSAYYLVTSLIWDLMRAAGSASILMFFAEPTLRALRRFQHRFAFDYSHLPEQTPGLDDCAGETLPERESGRKAHLPTERAAETR
jgi:energy-coupling factor transport system substrate-specific component